MATNFDQPLQTNPEPSLIRITYSWKSKFPQLSNDTSVPFKREKSANLQNYVRRIRS